MSYLDLCLIIPLALGMWKGWKRGFVFELAMLIGLVLGLYLAFKMSSLLEGAMAKVIDAQGTMLYGITFFVIFIAVILLMVLLAKFIEGILKAGQLSSLNQVAGAGFGLIKWALVVSVVLSVFRPLDVRLGILSAKTKSESYLYLPLLNFSQYLFPALKDVQAEFSKHVG